jgi:hypothetical protein
VGIGVLLLLALAVVYAPAYGEEETSASDGWVFEVTHFAWLPSIKGDAVAGMYFLAALQQAVAKVGEAK